MCANIIITLGVCNRAIKVNIQSIHLIKSNKIAVVKSLIEHLVKVVNSINSIVTNYVIWCLFTLFDCNMIVLSLHLNSCAKFD